MSEEIKREAGPSGKAIGKQRAADRLAAALRENLKRRKAQARGRRETAGPAAPADRAGSESD